jgi:hypothetical protein
MNIREPGGSPIELAIIVSGFSAVKSARTMTMQTRNHSRVLLLMGFLTAALASSAFWACSDISKEGAVESLQAVDIESYWTVRGKLEDDIYIRPIVRFRILNNGSKPVDYIQTMAVFRRQSAPEESWGSAFEYSLSGDPVGPGETSRLITLRSDSYYFSSQEPKAMLENEEWEQVTVEVFLKVGPSSWKPVGKMEVPKQLGAPGLEEFLTPAEASGESQPDTPEP